MLVHIQRQKQVKTVPADTKKDTRGMQNHHQLVIVEGNMSKLGSRLCAAVWFVMTLPTVQ